MNQSKRHGACGIDHDASRTAWWANACRAMANREKHPILHGPDDQAKIFIPTFKNFLLNFKVIRSYIRKKLTPGSYEYMLARTRHLDNIFLKALAEKVPQIVFLGAGYDTRSIRFRDKLHHTRIVELDAAATQKDKVDLLQKANISLPPQLSLATIDFRTEHLGDVLARAGYDHTQKCLFIWEGVTMYLPEEAIKATLAFTRNQSGPGSTIAFDYFFASVVDGSSEYYGAREQYEAVKKLGEPFQYGIEEGKIDTFLSDNGFHIISHHYPDELENAYLTDGNGALLCRMYRCGGIVHAGIYS